MTTSRLPLFGALAVGALALTGCAGGGGAEPSSPAPSSASSTTTADSSASTSPAASAQWAAEAASSAQFAICGSWNRASHCATSGQRPVVM